MRFMGEKAASTRIIKYENKTHFGQCLIDSSPVKYIQDHTTRFAGRFPFPHVPRHYETAHEFY